MGFIEKFNKQANVLKLDKTALYQEVSKHKDLLKDYGVNFKVKCDLDLFLLEILYKSMYNEWKINRAWDDFKGLYFDTFAYINYEEKRKMFNNDLAPVLAELPHFKDEASGSEIYIPHYETYINDWFVNDYSILTLKQHAEKLKELRPKPTTSVEFYGVDIYNTEFSSLIPVYEDERHIDFYFEDNHSIIIFLKEDFSVVNRVFLEMPKVTGTLTLDNVKELAVLFEEYKYRDALDYMLSHDLMNEKIHKKLSKKIKE